MTSTTTALIGVGAVAAIGGMAYLLLKPPGTTTKGTVNVTVEVTNESNTPLAGARVSLDESTETTGSGGTYTFDGVNTGSHIIQASASGYVTNSITVEVASSTPDFTIALQSECTAPPSCACDETVVACACSLKIAQYMDLEGTQTNQTLMNWSVAWGLTANCLTGAVEQVAKIPANPSQCGPFLTDSNGNPTGWPTVNQWNLFLTGIVYDESDSPLCNQTIDITMTDDAVPFSAAGISGTLYFPYPASVTTDPTGTFTVEIPTTLDISNPGVSNYCLLGDTWGGVAKVSTQITYSVSAQPQVMGSTVLDVNLLVCALGQFG